MFGDSQSVIASSTLPTATLKKRHNALSFHHVREAIAAGITAFYKIDGKHNPADILSKHGGYPDVWPVLKPLLFWHGDTAEIVDDTVQTKGESQDGKIKSTMVSS